MKNKTLLGIILCLALLFTATPLLVGQASTPVIWTDKTDYQPGDTVTIYGSGFLANAPITVSVTRPDFTVDSWTATSDSDGKFTTAYPLDGILGTYTVTASDGTNTASTTFTDLNWDFYGWDMVSNSWTKGNLAGWNEGDLVNYMLVISGAEGETIPTVKILYDFFDTSTKVPIGGVLVDYLTDFQYGDTDFHTNGQTPSGFTPFNPSVLTAPETTPDTAADPAPDRYLEIVPGTDVPATIPSSGTLVIYYTAHLARSPVWLNNLESNFPLIVDQISWVDASATPHYGASFFPGASPHFELDISGVGLKSIPIPVPPAPLGIISGHKWNDVNVNGVYDAGDLPLENWVINCEGTVDGEPLTLQTTTDANGLYTFELLTGGDWTISEDEILSGWAPTPGTYTSIPITLPLPAASPYGTEGSYEASNVDFFNWQPASSTTTLLSDTTITLGDYVTDTATVSGNGPTPTGTVDFEVSFAGGAWTPFDEDVPLVSGSATSDQYYPLAAGSYRFRAIYSGDTIYPSSQSGDEDEPLEVTPADSTTTTELSSTSIVLGNSVYDTVHVAGLGGSYPVPTGTVQFYVKAPGGSFETLGAPVALDGSGNAQSIDYTPLTTGTYYFKATYSGDSNYAGSSSGDEEEPLTVGKATPDVNTLLSDSSITLGDSVTDSVTVVGLGGSYPWPTGTVDFEVSFNGGAWTVYDDDVALTQSGSDGVATSAAYTPLAAGSYRFRAVYSGDGNYLGAQSGDEEEPLTVGKATPTVTTLLSPAGPIALGHSVTDTATVTGLSSPFPGPTGTVDFEVSTDGGLTWAPFDEDVPLVGGSATSGSYEPPVAGTYYFRAVYSGDDNYDPAASGDTDEPLTVEPVYFVKTFTASGSLTAGNEPPISPDGLETYVSEKKTGPTIWWEVTYTVTNEDTVPHTYIVWDKWGGNLLVLGGTPTDFDSPDLTLSNHEPLSIDPRKNDYRTYVANYLEFDSADYVPGGLGTDHGSAIITIHTGDQQEGTNPGKGNGNSKDGTSYDLDVRWEIGELGPGETATFKIIVAPGMNPGHQLEFTSCGTTIINTGPVIRVYEDDTYSNDGFLYSVPDTNQLTVYVVDPIPDWLD